MLSKIEYEAAMARLDVLMGLDPEPGSEDGRELTALVDEVLAYELEHYPILTADDPVLCRDGGEHDWSGPLYKREHDDGVIETGPTCARCSAEFGAINPAFEP